MGERCLQGEGGHGVDKERRLLIPALSWAHTLFALSYHRATYTQCTHCTPSCTCSRAYTYACAYALLSHTCTRLYCVPRTHLHLPCTHLHCLTHAYSCTILHTHTPVLLHSHACAHTRICIQGHLGLHRITKWCVCYPCKHTVFTQSFTYTHTHIHTLLPAHSPPGREGRDLGGQIKWTCCSGRIFQQVPWTAEATGWLESSLEQSRMRTRGCRQCEGHSRVRATCCDLGRGTNVSWPHGARLELQRGHWYQATECPPLLPVPCFMCVLSTCPAAQIPTGLLEGPQILCRSL